MKMIGAKEKRKSTSTKTYSNAAQNCKAKPTGIMDKPNMAAFGLFSLSFIEPCVQTIKLLAYVMEANIRAPTKVTSNPIISNIPCILYPPIQWIIELGISIAYKRIKKGLDKNRDMRALENSYSVPVEELADNIRNNVIVPLLRMAQKPKGLEIKRDDKLLEIGSIFENNDEILTN